MAPPLARLYPLLIFANKTQDREATNNFRQEKGSGGFPMPCECVALIVAFAPLFSKPVFQHAHVLLLGAMLSPGTRPETSALRVMGVRQDAQSQHSHRVLRRARWSGLAASQILLGLLVSAFAPTGTIVWGLEDTIERRRGEQITAKGIYRAPGRSAPAHFVKASG
jgi:DDE superfamily endonuclease